jgi:hypothetical protein
MKAPSRRRARLPLAVIVGVVGDFVLGRVWTMLRCWPRSNCPGGVDSTNDSEAPAGLLAVDGMRNGLEGLSSEKRLGLG